MMQTYFDKSKVTSCAKIYIFSICLFLFIYIYLYVWWFISSLVVLELYFSFIWLSTHLISICNLNFYGSNFLTMHKQVFTCLFLSVPRCKTYDALVNIDKYNNCQNNSRLTIEPWSSVFRRYCSNRWQIIRDHFLFTWPSSVLNRTNEFPLRLILINRCD